MCECLPPPQDYISLIANSLYLYLATLTQLYLFLCYKMNSQRYKGHHSIIKVGGQTYFEAMDQLCISV